MIIKNRPYNEIKISRSLWYTITVYLTKNLINYHATYVAAIAQRLAATTELAVVRGLDVPHATGHTLQLDHSSL